METGKPQQSLQKNSKESDTTMNANIRRETMVSIGSSSLNTPQKHEKRQKGKKDLSFLFGNLVFNERIQRQRLPITVFRSLQRTIKQGTPLDPTIAETIASTMRDWAIEHGVTHFTHWFQPMTGSTAEKHDCFITPLEGGESLSKFSGLELIRGESDASSFPSGGLRATFEARGYTAWDPTSPAFILRHPNGGTLVIPTIFVSWTGDALDKRTPLRRSNRAIGQQAIRILRLFGNTTATRVDSTLGAEQEYFLVDRRLAALRPDLMVTGRTLFGARPPKGQELDDNYFGSIPERVLAFMTELEQELLMIGVPVKTRHNEAAPGQFEFAPMFEKAIIATDHQMLVMQFLKTVAARHGFTCLLHEKPFAGVNGSGKHNNWSLTTDEGDNLFDPGATPGSNAQFLIFCAAVIRAVHKYGDLLRFSVSSAGNDLRLGGNEAPPAIISIFFGGVLDDIFKEIASGKFTSGVPLDPLDFGLPELPPLARDSGDRNRTSPFAFTGNKFEFRALGSSENPATSTTFLNTIVAESLSYIADRLEKAVADGENFKTAVQNLIVEIVKKHKKILFDGDCYSEDWKKEAVRRKLPNLATTADCLPVLISPASIDLFTRMRVYTETELRSRFEISTENYTTIVGIETLSALEISGTMILQAALKYKKDLQQAATTLIQKSLLEELDDCIDDLVIQHRNVREVYMHRPQNNRTIEAAEYSCHTIRPALEKLRDAVDHLEEIVDDAYWPLPTYTELLFSR